MALNAEVRDQAYQYFCQEAPEFLHAIETGLLTLREDQSTANVHQIMRAAHSIKGGAASVELEGIKEIAHKLEDVFRALYNWNQGIDRDMEELLLCAFDALRTPLLEQIETGSYDQEAALAHAEPIFATLEALLGDSLHNVDNALPTAQELGIDIAQVVFSGDVQQGIDRLRTVLDDPQAEVLGEFRAQAEVFAGIGELLNLPGFTQVARSVLTALNNHPEALDQIAPLALANFQEAQAQVLAGDREQGGTLNPALALWTQGNQESVWHDSLFLSNETEDVLPVEELPVEDSLSLIEPEQELSIFNPPEEEDDYTNWALDTEKTSSPLKEDINDDLSGWLSEDLMPPIVPLGENEDITEDLSGWSTEEFVELVNQEKEENSNTPVAEIDTTIQAPQTSKNKTKEKIIPAPAMTEVIRVDLQRLERLNNLVGELVTEENASELQLQQLQNTVKQLQERFTLFERLNRNLQTWLDQSQKIQVRNALQSSPSEFDPLQMDYYSPLYTMIQESIEEIAQMGEKVQDITLVAQQSKNIQRKKQQTLKQLRDDLLWARMIPLGDILNRFPRMVRDLSLKYKKAVNAKVVGANTLVDKQILEKLYDPLVHLVRNAFDHGIEPSPEERIARGKEAEGTIEIRAYHRGNQTFIEVHDDGGGIDPQKVIQKAIERGLVTPEKARDLTQQEIYEFLFAPDFSTADKVTDLSGRGMGMGAVLSQVQALKGNITIESELGKGTVFTLRLPLTLTISKLLVVRLNGRLMAVPVDSLVSVISTPRSEIETVWGKDFYRYERGLVPIYPSVLFSNHYPLPAATSKLQTGMELPEETVPLLLMALGNRMVALAAEEIVTEQELVIKPFSPVITPPKYLYGCTILGDGSLVPVIDATALIGQWLESQASPAIPTIEAQSPSFDVTTILVVDDSLTARQTLALTLARSGYEVIQASDGREALAKLKEHSIKAVFCDVEMPVMNGFEFLTNCRKEYPPDRLPVIMLTSRSGERHRGIAQLLGASGYLTKPFLEGDLLQTLQNCLQPVLA
ncbi:MAG: hybrid sensor histidine kinase/response regulator [Cyanobacteria bacterium M5B4]|nr:MAG: hybrid sensor histidine kinase/response regulator [Cyanobacteria bacterium M5B4]